MKKITFEEYKKGCAFDEFGECIYNEDPDALTPCNADVCPEWSRLPDCAKAQDKDDIDV